MIEDNEVIIYSKQLKLDVVIPKDKVWDFALAFGEAFKVKEIHSSEEPKAIDGYYSHPFGYHVQVTVHISEEQKFYKFLAEFCRKEGLPVREEDLKVINPFA
ncbi:MAG: hypothetical protein WCT50_02480 [Patescibacteria group bacterium]|jgi:hypothetical protein